MASRQLDAAIRRSFDTHNLKIEPQAHTQIRDWLADNLDDVSDSATLKQVVNQIVRTCKEKLSSVQGTRKVEQTLIQVVLKEVESAQQWNTENQSRRANLNTAVDGTGDSQLSVDGSAAVKQRSQQPSHATRKLPHVSVLSAFKTPRFKYHSVTKQFHVTAAPSQHQLCGASTDKSQMLIDRYELHWQKLQRNELFSPPVTILAQHTSHLSGTSITGTNYHQIINITDLLSKGLNGGRLIIFGMITTGSSDHDFMIEDLYARVQVDLSQAVVASGFYTQYSFVLAEGEMIDDTTFKVMTLGHPPSESRTTSLAAHAGLSLFGANSDLRPSDLQVELQLQQEELQQHTNDMIVMLSDIHLDKPQTFDRLKTLFDGLSAAQPAVFVLMGNFTSKQVGGRSTTQQHDIQQLKQHFDALADLILQYPSLAKQSHWVFVGGPRDPAIAAHNILPSAGLPTFLTARLRDRLPHAHFATNPCRLTYYGKEIVLYREDLLHKIRRNTILQPSIDSNDHGTLTLHLVKTIVEQGHLSPLPLTVKPIYWQYDHALRLYPLPDVMVLADCVDQYEHDEQCLTLNPGQFSADASFVVYMPASNKVEWSRIE